jgi:hypothetical protein
MCATWKLYVNLTGSDFPEDGGTDTPITDRSYTKMKSYEKEKDTFVGTFI